MNDHHPTAARKIWNFILKWAGTTLMTPILLAGCPSSHSAENGERLDLEEVTKGLISLEEEREAEKAAHLSEKNIDDDSEKPEKCCPDADKDDGLVQPTVNVGKINRFHISNAEFPIITLDGIDCPLVHFENSQFGTILIRNGKIGTLKIKNVSFKLLDISGTQAGSYDIDPDPSGTIESKGSNYPQGGHRYE